MRLVMAFVSLLALAPPAYAQGTPTAPPPTLVASVRQAIADKDFARGERLIAADVAASGLDWILVQPVHLTDGAEDDMPFVSTEGDTGKMKVSRNSVGHFLAQAVVSPEFVGKSVSLSSQAAAA